jgi:CDP-glucose 4,6-dehydratase
MENLVGMQNLFGGIFQGKRVLITGHTGFKGSWLALWLSKMGAQVSGYSLNEGTSPSHFALLGLNINSEMGDIRDKKKLEAFVSNAKPQLVFHLAAQSLVRESYRNPSFTYETNVVGTLNVFEASRKCGTVSAIVNVTTDKVYENIEQHVAYNELDRLGGFDLYSSSKACSELLTSSYRNSFLHDYSILLASARAGNVIGGGDWAKERLVPDLILGASAKQTTEIRSPRSIRPWEHVLEPVSGYLLLGKQLLMGNREFAEAWNFGPEPDKTLETGEVVKRMQEKWPSIHFRINEEESKQFHEAAILKLDCSKAREKLLWAQVWNMDETIERTVSWYRNYYENNRICSEADLEQFVLDASKVSVNWSMQ